MILPSLKVFIMVIAFWVRSPTNPGGLQGYNESHAFQAESECNVARNQALTQVTNGGQHGIVAYFISPCIPGDMTLLGDDDAKLVK